MECDNVFDGEIVDSQENDRLFTKQRSTYNYLTIAFY
jgi:hypothetical protein